MGKLEYLDALKRAMAGLPPDTIAKTLAYYEQRFIDGQAAGLSEQEIYAQLDEPRKIAMTLRANAHMSAFEQKKNPVSLLRMLISLVGLAIFNLFMVIPAAVYAALLMSMYAVALSFYVAGIAITASGLSGANELVLDGPLRHMVIFDDDDNQSDAPMQTKVSIGDTGIQIFQEPAANAQPTVSDDSHKPDMLQKAEAMASSGVHISNDADAESRTTQTVIGLVLVLCGIALFLIDLVVTRYTMVGIRRYIEMNFAMLRGR